MSKPHIVAMILCMISMWLHGYSINNNNTEAKVAGYVFSVVLAFVAAVTFLNT